MAKMVCNPVPWVCCTIFPEENANCYIRLHGSSARDEKLQRIGFFLSGSLNLQEIAPNVCTFWQSRAIYGSARELAYLDAQKWKLT
jgi:hypothetical protein